MAPLFSSDRYALFHTYVIITFPVSLRNYDMSNIVFTNNEPGFSRVKSNRLGPQEHTIALMVPEDMRGAESYF